MRPYISLDIETTGVDRERSEILEIGWVLDNGIGRIEDLVKRNFIVNKKVILYGEIFALDMNARIFKALKERHPDVMDSDDIAQQLMSDVEDCSRLALQWDKDHLILPKDGRQNKKIQLAGKNFSAFDSHFIDPFMKEHGQFVYFKKIQHRALDVGPMYAEEFGYVPSLPEICDRYNGKTVDHKAVSDALLVVELIRNKMKLG